MLSLLVKYILINVFPWNKLKKSISTWQIHLVKAQCTNQRTLYTYNHVSHMTPEVWPFMSHHNLYHMIQYTNSQSRSTRKWTGTVQLWENSQKFYTVPVYHCQFVFLLGFKFFRFAHLSYILPAPLIRSGKTRTN